MKGIERNRRASNYLQAYQRDRQTRSTAFSVSSVFIFLLLTASFQERIFQVANTGNEAEKAATIPQPAMTVAINLHEHAFLRVANAPTTMLCFAAFGFSQQLSSLQDGMHARSRQHDAFPLLQQIAQVVLITPRIGGACYMLPH